MIDKKQKLWIGFVMILTCLLFLAMNLKAQVPVEVEVITKEVQVYGNDLYKHLFDETAFHEVRIVISQGEFDGLSQDMLAYSVYDDRMRTGNYRQADMYYLYEDEWLYLDQVGIRTKGNTSRILPEEGGALNKFHFKLKFDETFDYEKSDPDGIRLSARDFGGLSALQFKWQAFSDTTYVREATAYEMLKNAGVITSQAAHVHVVFEIAGEELDYGMYTMIEPIDKAFLTKRFGAYNNDGDLYKCLWQNYGPATLESVWDSQAVGSKEWETNYRPAYDLKTNKEHSTHSDLLNFIELLNDLEGEEFETFIENHFDVEGFLKYQAMGVLIGMPDDYWAMGNNYFLYFDNEGVCHFIPYDYDSGFGGGWDAAPWGFEGIANADVLSWYNLNAEFMGQDYEHPLVDKLLAISYYREKYLGYIEAYVNKDAGVFSYNHYIDNMTQFEALYGDYIDNDIYGDMVFQAGNEAWYFNEKINSVNEQLELLGDKNDE